MMINSALPGIGLRGRVVCASGPVPVGSCNNPASTREMPKLAKRVDTSQLNTDQQSKCWYLTQAEVYSVSE